MGDRTNPIKFGPEWLRNLAQERSNLSGPEAQTPGVGATGAPPGMGGYVAGQRPGANFATATTKVQLARLRYGREEMLALYDRLIVEAPPQLKANDILYMPRGQPPYALNNSFDDDNRESASRQPAVSATSSTSERYSGAGRGRGLAISEMKIRGIPLDSRGRARGYNRPASAGRAWHANQRGGYSGVPDEDPNPSLRPWSNTTHQTSPGLRPNTELPDWQAKQHQYRKRHTNTNWRQHHGRDEGEEWRSTDGARRPQDKWAEWGWQQEASNRPNQEKPWHNNRRTWMGGDGNEDSLPEWAVDNAEACSGTFDSSGAFHGYSNDDSNIPKTQDTLYPLVKSHTHGSFARTKTAEEGSEEWWASEKAKKLSPKRFDTNEMPLKKLPSEDEKLILKSATTKESSSASNEPCTHSTGAIPKRSYKTTSRVTTANDKPVKNKLSQPLASKEDKDNSPERKTSAVAAAEPNEYNQNKPEDSAKDKMFDSRSNSEKQNEKANFMSVILTQNNNTLRQKHQNIVTPPVTAAGHKQMPYSVTMRQPKQLESANEFTSRKVTENSKIVEDMLQMKLEDGIPCTTMNQLLTSHSNSMDSQAQVPFPPMQQMRMAATLQNLNAQATQNIPLTTGLPTPEAYNGMMQQPIGVTNTMLNASLGLPIPNPSAGLPHGISPTLPNTKAIASALQAIGGENAQQSNLQQGSMQTAGLQSAQIPGLQGLDMQSLQGYGTQAGGPLQNQLGGMPNSGLQAGAPGLQSAGNVLPNVANAPLINNEMQLVNDMNSLSVGGPNAVGDPMAEIHRLQQLVLQRINAMYGNMMNQPPPLNNMNMPQLMSTDQWYYEDPYSAIQGPFTAKEMFHWYSAGFFSPTLLVRRDCDVVMRPLGSFGPMPFGPMIPLPPYQMGGYDLLPQQPHENMMNPQPGLGIDGPSTNGHVMRQPPHIESNMQYNPRNNNQAQIHSPVNPLGPWPPHQTLFQLVQNDEVQGLWGQPENVAANADHMWLQAMNNNPPSENPINNLPMHFWDNQRDDSTPPPDTMQTEEEILAQMRAGKLHGPTSPLSFFAESPAAAQEVDAVAADTALNVNQLQKLLQKNTDVPAATENSSSEQQEPVKPVDAQRSKSEVSTEKGNKTTDKTADVKPTKEVAKVESDKPKVKEVTKPKSKKAKEEKKEEIIEVKTKEEEIKVEKHSSEPSPSRKIKKEDKSTKNDLDKEKKEWIKEGFTIVKGAEKSKDKDSKKKTENETKAAEEAERKRKEEEKQATDERKRRAEAIQKRLEEISPVSTPSPLVTPTRHGGEPRKAPWLASSHGLHSGTRDGPTLAEIQRLEREKKLEQMKEQQHMMQLIAQQQAVAMARDQEVQTGLGWAKNMSSYNITTPHQSLAEIQAEARMKVVATAAEAAAADMAAVREQMMSASASAAHTMPWTSIQNGAGFWDSPSEPVKPVTIPGEACAELKHKKKVTIAPPKPENTPSVEFEMWCTNMLISWRDTGIDVPTFVSFLRDIESPYEVKDYVKCYLGDSREASDFARQFLEKRSRLMRVGMVTPSDDLCSPAIAVNPRTNSGSDYADLKAKGKKTKKNKMLKVDARNILGFSVTASEDRINVGDIDSV